MWPFTRRNKKLHNCSPGNQAGMHGEVITGLGGMGDAELCLRCGLDTYHTISPCKSKKACVPERDWPKIREVRKGATFADLSDFLPLRPTNIRTDKGWPIPYPEDMTVQELVAEAARWAHMRLRGHTVGGEEFKKYNDELIRRKVYLSWMEVALDDDL